jgi:hypothetical protein
MTKKVKARNDRKTSRKKSGKEKKVLMKIDVKIQN